MQAIILAAGMGKRLKSLTQDNTKCMVKVNSVTLIERMLMQLERLNLREIVIVVGYQCDKLMKFIEGLSIKTPITYIKNDIYDKTNNIYSLSLAKEYLCMDDTLLLESDLIFEDRILEELVKDKRDTLALVDKYESWMDGTVVKIDENDKICAFVPGSRFVFEEIPQYYKTVNIYKFSKKFSQMQYVPFLEAYMSALGNNEYYEQVLRVITLLDNPMIKAKKLDGQLWYEIDDVQDLDIAASIFIENKEEKLKSIVQRYGGYWRYPKLLNFSYPDNPFFPPAKMIDELKANVEKLISEYPSCMKVNSLLVAKNLGGLDSEWVVVSNGIEEIIKSILSLHTGIIGMIKPINEEYKNRKELEKIEFFISNNSELTYTAGDIISYFEEKKIELLILANPDYHSGNYICKRDVLKILDWSKQKGIRVLLDESYCDFSDEENNSLLCEEILFRFPKLVILKNLSVTHGVAGLRLGCAVSSDLKFVKLMKEDVAIWNINSFAEFYLQIEEKYQKQYVASLEKFKKMRKAFLNDLKKIPYLRIVPTQANYVMCEVYGGITAKKLTEILLNEYNILIKDLTDKVDGLGQYVKFAMRTESENRILLDALMCITDTYEGRIYGEAIDINEVVTQDFFEKRVNKELPHRYNYVIYQDTNPMLALKRDLYEKEKMSKILQFTSKDYVLDIGCGVGRWGDEVVKYLVDGKYVGVDFSEKLLEVAKENLMKNGKCNFLQGSFQDVVEVLGKSGFSMQFDVILVNGVLMYINDKDIRKCLGNIDLLSKKGGKIYIKESVGVEQRFTLKDFFSQELSSTYNAIYRSLEEYNLLLQEFFVENGYHIISEGETWEDAQKNRKETTSYYWILEK